MTVICREDGKADIRRLFGRPQGICIKPNSAGESWESIKRVVLIGRVTGVVCQLKLATRLHSGLPENLNPNQFR